MYNGIHLAIHPTSYHNVLVRVVICKLPFRQRTWGPIPFRGPNFVLTRLLSLSMLKKTLFIETRVVATRKGNFMFEYTVGSSTIDPKFARDAECILYRYSRTKS